MLIFGENMLCHVIHIFFGFSLGKVNCHLCRICVTNFREGASLPSASSYKRPIMNRVSIDEGNLHIFRKTPNFFRILMKFSEKICLMIMLKVTEILGCTISLYKMQFWKSYREWEANWPPPSLFKVKNRECLLSEEVSSVKWTVLGQILQTQKMQILTPVVLLFFH